MKDVVFTESQLQAMDVSQRRLDACVVAGPGSGKTTVLVEYFRSLVEEGIDPLRILAITFTEKAAANMRAKLAEQFHDNPDRRAQLERAWVSTVHGFCMRLLKENAVFAGVDPQFRVADERESWRFQQESINEAVAALFAEHPEAVRKLIRGLSSANFEDAVLSAYDAMRGAGMRLEDVAAKLPPRGVTREEIAETARALAADSLSGWRPDQKSHRDLMVEQTLRIANAPAAAEALQSLKDYSGTLRKCKQSTTGYHLAQRLREQLKALPYTLITDLYQPERELLFEILRRFDRGYRERKRQAGVVDFADLEEFAVRLLEENRETCARVQAQFEHIMMDEFQDTNGQQAKLLGLLRRPDRFYAVGDINQSIYGFRHAEPEVFRNYRDRASRRIELVENFRSRADILRAVETIAAGARGIESRTLVSRREFNQPRDLCVELIASVAPQIDDALHQEARWVAWRIRGLLEGGEPALHFKDIAVLVRNTEVLGEFAAAFDEQGIPYLVNRGRGFYEGREVNDLTHLLRVIANPLDEVSLAVVLRSPLVQLSDEGLLALRAAGADLGVAMRRLGPDHQTQFDAGDFEKLRHFRDRLSHWRARREHVAFDRLLLEAIDDCGYPCEPATRSSANIEKFLAQARQAAARMSLDDFVEELALVRASNPREPDAPPDDSANAVNMMTVHSAKGLEFPVVFVAALHKGVESNPPVVAFSRQFGIGARWRNPADGSEKDDLFQHALREERKQREAEESDRLLYVAMTRAEQHLVLSFSTSGNKISNWAEQVTGSLHLDLEPPRDETLKRTSPDGKEWTLRVLVKDGPPPADDRPVHAGTRPDPVPRIARPVAGDQQDANAPVTAIAAFAKCPREYYLGHYLGLEGRARPLRDAGQLPAAELGTQVHDLLAGAAVADADPEAVRLAGVFRQSALGRRVARAARVEREFDFLMAVDGLVLRGQVDLWFEEGGELAIVDYKTDAVTAHEAHQRALEYAVQVRLYAMAVERVTGRAPDRAWLHFLKPDTAIEVDLWPSLLDGPEQIVRDFQEAQSRLEFPLVEGPHCGRCAFYRDLCPSHYRS